MSTLENIRKKVRRLTGRPSINQISDSEIDFYINTFYQYDFPENLKLFSLQGIYEFMTEANVDIYDLPDPNIYSNIIPPVYIAGYQSFWSQDREQFFRIYPKLAEITTSISGDGTAGPYNFILPNIPMLQNEVSIGAIDSTGSTVQIVDSPQNRTTGNWIIIGTATVITGNINYITGVGTITFNNTIPLGNEITITHVPYQPNRPQAILYFDNQITLRPVPDKPYKVTVNAFKTPTALINSGDAPDLNLWWQYLAYGASKKIFEDSQDPEGVSNILPGFKEQERIVLRRSIIQQTTQRTATIYTEMTQFPYGNYYGNRF